MLWKIEGSNTYILGSIHATNINPLVLVPLVEEIFAASTRIAFETDLGAARDQKVMLLPDNGKLADLIPAPLFAATRAHWLRLGLRESLLNDRQPLFVAMTLEEAQITREGYRRDLGVDRVLWARAQLEGKQRQGLEPPNATAHALAAVSVTEQISYLEHIVGQEDLGLSDIVATVAAWRSGNIDFFAPILQRHQRWPLFFEVLFTARNRSWCPSIVAMVRDGIPTLVVVGVGHLLGKTGLSALFKEHGLTVVSCS